ncbi:MAG: deoxyribose-phosphate aldolase, partial [Bdellovibrionales bacterium]|nr:deoxyribose-phosphate aldolase [Bdellovibrionales bacterium]
RDWQFVFNDIRSVVHAAGKIPVKVILETCLLSDEEKVAAAAISELAGASFVKTSTGFSTGGATTEDISLLRKVVSPKVKIKASSGVKTRQFAEELIAAGADRLGTSSSVSIVVAGKSNQTQGSY